MSILFPIVVLVIIIMFLITFYVNDMVCIRAVVNQYAVTTDISGKTNEEVIYELKKELKDKVLVVNIKDIKVNRKKDKMAIGINTNFKLGIWKLEKNDEVNIAMYTTDNTMFVVRAKVFIDTVKKIKGE